MRQERADAMLERGLPLALEDFYRLNKQRIPRQGESILRLPGAEGSVEVLDPPDGFEAPSEPEPAAEPIERAAESEPAAVLPFTRSARAALRRHQAGDLHEFRLAA